MSTARCIALCLTLSSLPALAEEPAKPTGASFNDVLALAPADALFVLCARDLAAVLDNPALEIIAAEGGPDLPALGRAWEEIFDGPTMIAVQGLFLRPDAVGVSFAARVTCDRDELLDRLNKHLGSERTVGDGKGALIEAGRSGDFGTVRILAPPFPTLYLAVRNGTAYADTSLATAIEFAKGRGVADRLVDGDDYRRLRPAAGKNGAKHPDLLAYLNLRPLVAMLEPEMEREAPGIYDAFELDAFESVLLTTDFSGPRGTVNLAVGVSTPEAMLPSLLLPANGKIDALTMLPADCLAATAGAMRSASDWVDALCRLFERIDPDIASEYQAERREVAREWGFDPQHDFLGNMVDQWAVGLTLDEDNEPGLTIAVKLADPDLFIHHLRQLVTAYRLPIETQVYGATEILCRADGGNPASPEIQYPALQVAVSSLVDNLCLAVVDDYLVASGQVANVAAVIDARAKRTADSGSGAKTDTATPRSAPAAKVGFLNIARLAQLALAEEEVQPDDAEPYQTVRRVAQSDARIDFRATTGPKRLSVGITLNESMTTTARGFLTQSLAASLAQARSQKCRVISMANIKNIVVACKIHANDHKGQWPASLGELAADGSVGLQQFANPCDGTAPTSAGEVDLHSFYLYRPGLDEKTVDARLVVLAEREIHRGQGANFGFADGHVEWVEEPRAGELLAEIRLAAR